MGSDAGANLKTRIVPLRICRPNRLTVSRRPSSGTMRLGPTTHAQLSSHRGLDYKGCVGPRPACFPQPNDGNHGTQERSYEGGICRLDRPRLGEREARYRLAGGRLEPNRTKRAQANTRDAAPLVSQTA